MYSLKKLNIMQKTEIKVLMFPCLLDLKMMKTQNLLLFLNLTSIVIIANH